MTAKSVLMRPQSLRPGVRAPFVTPLNKLFYAKREVYEVVGQ